MSPMFIASYLLPVTLFIVHAVDVLSGHCPHDELPVEVNSILSEWTSTAESCTNAIKGAKSF